jgi:hypothetical protein
MIGYPNLFYSINQNDAETEVYLGKYEMSMWSRNRLECKEKEENGIPLGIYPIPFFPITLFNMPPTGPSLWTVKQEAIITITIEKFTVSYTSHLFSSYYQNMLSIFQRPTHGALSFPRKIKKNLSQDIRSPGRDLTPDMFRIRYCSAIHLSATFGLPGCNIRESVINFTYRVGQLIGRLVGQFVGLYLSFVSVIPLQIFRKKVLCITVTSCV